MNRSLQDKALKQAVKAAGAAGAIMRANFRSAKKVNVETHHDIKLELDVLCQERIEKIVKSVIPSAAILGEEGVSGDPEAEYRWVIDPIDGTVNFAYGIPHACTSIALQAHVPGANATLAAARMASTSPEPGYQTVLGVVYDPFCNELWTALRGQPARLNNRIIHVSSRNSFKQAIIAIGFAKYDYTVEKMLPIFAALMRRVRKIRLMGSAALSMVYVATGRMDAYVESNIRLWDIAAGGLLLECAGGDFFHESVFGPNTPGPHTYRILANNGLLRRPLWKLTYGISGK